MKEPTTQAVFEQAGLAGVLKDNRLTVPPNQRDYHWEEPHVTKLFKDVSIKEWIAKDSYLPAKADLSLTLEISPKDVGATEADFDKMTMSMDGEVKYYDYNKPLSIELPAAAANAPEIPLSQ